MIDNITESIYFRNNELQDEESEISEETEDKFGSDVNASDFQSSIWFNENQHYAGDLFRNCLHGQGFYSVENRGQKLFYDALFYLNKLEGYCQIFYHNQSHFQGLFRENKRYGPGVYTYPDGSQDVGFWDRFQITRLSAVVENGAVPMLAKTTSGRCRLIKYKTLVPIREDQSDVAAEILQKLGATDEEILRSSQEMYNNDVQHKDSLFFNRKLYDEAFFGKKDDAIEVELQRKPPETIRGEGEGKEPEENCNRINRLTAEIQKFQQILEPLTAKRIYLQGQVDWCCQCCKQIPAEDDTPSDVVDNVSNIQGSISVKVASHHKSGESFKGGLDLGSLFGDVSATSSMYTFNTLELSGVYVRETPAASRVSQSFDREFPDLSSCNDAITVSTQEIMDYCVCPEEGMDGLPEMMKQLEAVTKEEMFYITIKDNLKVKLDRELFKSFLEKPATKKIVVTEICPWNSDSNLVEMLKHCFRCRKFENMVNCNVTSIISSKREEFDEVGEYEETCRNFLKNCSTGCYKEVVEALRRQNVNPDLADARGNTGIFFAVSKNQLKLIPALANFGANLNMINDENLTPLNLCILKYLAVSNNYTNWETAFLKESSSSEDREFFKIYPIRSFLDLSTHTLQSSAINFNEEEFLNERVKHILNKVELVEDVEQHSSPEQYAFNLDYKELKKHYAPSVSNHHVKTANKKTKGESTGGSITDVDSKLKAIISTILTLLEYGVIPEIGEVPYPALICAVFTECSIIVRALLEASADPNITIENNLSPLHVAASMKCSKENVTIFKDLLDFGANPNLKTTKEHWLEQKQIILSQTEEEFEDNGKNPFHLLCMRKDYELDYCEFFQSLTEALISNNVDLNDFYLGHTALSLAVLYGNTDVIRSLLTAKELKPYALLQYDMGNVLTVHALKKYEYFLDIEKTLAILHMLVNAGINPLHSVGEYNNCFEFLEKPIPEELPEITGKGKAKPKKLKKPKIDKKSYQFKVIEHLKNLCREVMIKRTQLVATEILYDFTEENLLDIDDSITLAEYLAPDMVLKNLKTLFNRGKIPEERFDIQRCVKLLEFVDLHKKVTKPKKTKEKTKKEAKPKAKDKKNKKDNSSLDDHKSDVLPMTDWEEIIAAVDFSKKKDEITPVVFEIPGFDDPSQYKVCYNCLKSVDKTIYPCPKCDQFYYCSEQCNKLGLKLKTPHSCDVYFYTAEPSVQDQKQQTLSKVAKEVRRRCKERMLQKIRDKIREDNDLLYEDWKLDKYGLKYYNRNVLKERMELLKSNYITQPQPQTYPVKSPLELYSGKSSFDDYADSPSASLRQASLKLKAIEIISNEKHAKTDEAEHKKQPPRMSLEQFKPCLCNETIIRLPNVKSFSYPDDVLAKFKVSHPGVTVKEKDASIVKNVRKMPKKYWYFLELLSRYCLDVDMSFWYLPYACYSDGQLYYKFLNNDLFTESYSLL